MKKLLFTLLISITTLAYSQAPQQISYQGVARNASGTVLANQPIGIRFDIHQGSASGSIVFSETHTGVLTNGFGLFTTYIGSISNLSVINWATNSYFIEVSIDPNTGTFSSLGSQQLMSVPYALNAGSAPAPAVSFTNNILSVGGNTTTISTGTTYTAGTGINVTGNTITNAAPDQIVTITPAGSASVSGTYPNFTVSTPTIQTYSAGNGIDITGGVISNTAAAVTPTITGTGATTVNGTYPNLTINTPTTQVYTAGNGIDITGGIISNTLTPITPTITSTGIAVVTPTTGNTFNVDVPVPVLSYTAGTNVLSLSQGTTVTTATLNGTGSNTVSIVGSGLATVTPTTGSTFTVSVPNPTLSVGGGSISISGGNSVAIPTTSVVSTNTNISVSNAAGVYSVTAVTPTLTGLAGINVSGSYPNQTISSTQGLSIASNSIITLTPAGGNITITPAALTYTPATNVLRLTDGLAINTHTLNNYTQGTGISVTGSAPNFTISNASPAVTPTITGTGVATVNNVSPNYTVNVPMSIYNNNTGVFTTGTQTITVAPTLTLTGTTLTSGPATNSVNLSGFNGIYGGSGSIQTGSTTVTVGTNTLTFLSGNTNKPIANFFGGGFTGSFINVGHVATNGTGIKFVGSATTTPVSYGQINANSSNGITIIGGASSTGIYATGNDEVGVGTFTTGTGKFVVTHAATQANPTMHLRENSGALSRIKFSNIGVPNRFFEVGASVNAADDFSAYSISFHDGTNYKSRFLIYGNGKTSINNMHTALTTFHVMDDNATSPGIATEGFGFAGQMNLTRNNPLGVSPTYTRGAVSGIQEIGKINFAAHDGSTYGDGAKIYAKTTENVTTGTRGTELIFAAVPTGTNSNKDAFKINGLGQLEVISSIRIPGSPSVTPGQVLTAVDALGNASWQTITAPASPWIQSAGTVTLGVATSSVGIGIASPTAKLHILNTNPFSQGLFVQNNAATASSAIEVTQAGSSTGITSIINNPTNSQNSVYAETAGTGVAFGAKNTNASNTAYAGIFDGGLITRGKTINSAAFALRAQSSSSVDLLVVRNDSKVGIGTNNPSAQLTILNSTTADEGFLVTNNTTNNGIRVVQNGTGNGIFAGIYNSSSSAKAIEAQTDGTGSTIGASNTGSGSAGSFAISNATNTAAALYVSTIGTGNAIYAANSSSTAPTADFANSSADVVRAISSGGLGRALVASSNSNGTSAVDITNTGTGSALGAYKNAGSTGGNVANFANNSILNGDDVLRAHNTGTAAAIHASNNAVDPTSALTLWVENGHIKATQATAAVVTTVTATGGLSATGVALTLGTCNDVKGSLTAVCTTTGMINPGGQVTFRVSFNKSYSVNPTVVVTPNTDPGQMSYYISNINTGFFNVTFKNNTASNLSGPSFTFGFNYMVIE